MSRSQAVAPHLPLLRRYARALTGSQASGDAYVAAMLEALLQDPSVLDNRASSAGRAVSAVHPDLEFGVGQRQGRAGRRRPAVRAAAGPYHPAAAPGLPAAVAGRLFREGSGVHPGRRYSDAAPAGRGSGPRTGGRDRHRRADHRGRDLHRDGSRKPGRKPRPPRHRRRAHPCRGGGAGQGQAARPDPRRYPARRRLVRASTRSTNCCARSRCR